MTTELTSTSCPNQVHKHPPLSKTLPYSRTNKCIMRHGDAFTRFSSVKALKTSMFQLATIATATRAAVALRTGLTLLKACYLSHSLGEIQVHSNKHIFTFACRLMAKSQEKNLHLKVPKDHVACPLQHITVLVGCYAAALSAAVSTSHSCSH
jgi:hypothetical protein